MLLVRKFAKDVPAVIGIEDVVIELGGRRRFLRRPEPSVRPGPSILSRQSSGNTGRRTFR